VATATVQRHTHAHTPTQSQTITALNAGTKLYCLLTVAHVRERFVKGHCPKVEHVTVDRTLCTIRHRATKKTNI